MNDFQEAVKNALFKKFEFDATLFIIPPMDG